MTLGRSAKHALERMGLAYGGKSAKAIRDQGARLSACSLRWSWEHNGGNSNHRGAIITSAFTLHDEDERQDSLFSDTVVIDAEFFAALKKHPVPFSEEAIRHLSYSPMAMDVYALARLPAALPRAADRCFVVVVGGTVRPWLQGHSPIPRRLPALPVRRLRSLPGGQSRSDRSRSAAVPFAAAGDQTHHPAIADRSEAGRLIKS